MQAGNAAMNVAVQPAKQSQVEQELNAVGNSLEILETEIAKFIPRLSGVLRSCPPTAEGKIGNPEEEIVPVAASLRGIRRRVDTLQAILSDARARLEV